MGGGGQKCFFWEGRVFEILFFWGTGFKQKKFEKGSKKLFFRWGFQTKFGGGANILFLGGGD